MIFSPVIACPAASWPRLCTGLLSFTAERGTLESPARSPEVPMKLRQPAIFLSVLLWASVASAATVPGRIAISSDGNKHDCDDLFATAVSVAVLAKSGNAAKLRYYGHSDHIWATS